MIKIKPFKPIIPSKTLAERIPILSYSLYSPEEIQEKKKKNKYSFFHVINPADLSSEERHTPEHYKKVFRNLLDFLNNKYLVRWNHNFFVLIQKKVRNEEYVFLTGIVNIDHITQGIILPHESIVREREKRLVRYLHYCDVNAEPVIVFHEDHSVLNQIYSDVMTGRMPRLWFEPEEEPEATYKMWLIGEHTHPEVIKAIQGCFESISKGYISDGHHRASASVNFAHSLMEKGYSKKGKAEYILVSFIPQSGIKVLPYHRTLKTLHPYSREQFLEKLQVFFNVIEDWNNVGFIPEKPYYFGMYMRKKWYRLQLKEAFLQEIQEPHREISSSVFSKFVCERILRMGEDAATNVIRPQPGTITFGHLENMVDSGHYAVAFTLAPLSVNAIKRVAEEHIRLPFKSTGIEPKLMTGMVLFDLEVNKKFPD